MRSSGFTASAISAMTSLLTRSMVLTLQPYWRLKLGTSNRSKSAMLKAPTPRRARVIMWTPPTPPMPASAMRMPRRASCSASVSQPTFRSNAASYVNFTIVPAFATFAPGLIAYFRVHTREIFSVAACRSSRVRLRSAARSGLRQTTSRSLGLAGRSGPVRLKNEVRSAKQHYSSDFAC